MSGFKITWSPKVGLSRDHELELVRRYQQGDRQAGAELLECFAPFIRNAVMRYRDRGLELEDLMQEGGIGFLLGVLKFDLESGLRLTTYCRYKVRSAVQRAFRDVGRLVRVPQQTYQQLAEGRALGAVTADDFERLNILTRETAQAAFDALARTQELDAPTGDEQRTTYLDKLVDERPDPEEQCARAEIAEIVRLDVGGQLYGSLTDRQRKVLTLLYGQGTDSEEERTFDSIGNRLGCSRERVRQIQEVAFKKLRKRAKLLKLV